MQPAGGRFDEVDDLLVTRAAVRLFRVGAESGRVPFAERSLSTQASVVSRDREIELLQAKPE